ncbi:type III secretion system outer membrane ring subunit SctC [Dyella sp.]|uniref:type III secretion system outer membrane ring subunit SctC n=1 Tax=Dyella sp. TaxID=1869338 RepID=UPI002ED4CCE8
MTLLACLATAANSSPVPWRTVDISYQSNGKPLRQVLKDILATQPFPVVVSGSVRGDVRGDFKDTAEHVFKRLEAAYGLVWYFDGAVMHIASADDTRSEVMALAPLSPDDAMRALSRLGLIDERFPVRSAGGSLFVSGPSGYVELISRALSAERESVTAQRGPIGLVGENDANAGVDQIQSRRGSSLIDGSRLLIFPLKYAQAKDTTRQIGGRSETIPGVATLLSHLLDGRRPVAPAGERADQRANGSLRGVVNEALIPPFAEPDARAGRDYMLVDAPGTITVEADPRTNSVIVRDQPSNRPYYETAIAELDTAQHLVALDITIVDLTESAMRDLGVSLGLRANRVAGATPEPDTDGALLRGVLGGGANSLVVRLNALEKRGKARVFSQPRILTLENLQAVIGNQESTFIRASGVYTTNVYPITAGLVVRVTPQVIIRPEESRQIQLLLDITDGQLTQANGTEDAPVQRESFIVTQAIVEEGQTLLVGGYRYDRKAFSTSGVPGLSKIPVVGALFRRKTNERNLTERLFIITPRTVTMETTISPVITDMQKSQPAA